jgi:hypothetical protein
MRNLSRRTLLIVAVALAGGTLLLWAAHYVASSDPIEIIRAEYGVPGRTCVAGAELARHVSEACGGLRPRCLVSVSTGWCGDPAPGELKTLTVDYKCGETHKRAAAADHTGLELACP